MKEAILAAVGFAIVALMAASVYLDHRRFHKPMITTQYHAVVLQGGGTYYGRIDHLGTDYPILRDAFTIRRERDLDTQQPRYVLVKRKDESNGADHMIFPSTSIAFIEPVQPDSMIGKLIAEENSRK